MCAGRPWGSVYGCIQKFLNKQLSHINFRTEFADQGKPLQLLLFFIGNIREHGGRQVNLLRNIISDRGKFPLYFADDLFINIADAKIARMRFLSTVSFFAGR